MEMNPDCIRDILFAVEDLLPSPYRKELGLEVPGYSKEEIYYHLMQLKDAGLVRVKLIGHDGTNSYFVEGLTSEGHEFLYRTRKPKDWEKIKKALSEFAKITVPILIEKVLLSRFQ